MGTNPMTTVAEVALDWLLEYAKYLEDNNSLSYDLLKQRVESFKEGNL